MLHANRTIREPGASARLFAFKKSKFESIRVGGGRKKTHYFSLWTDHETTAMLYVKQWGNACAMQAHQQIV